MSQTNRRYHGDLESSTHIFSPKIDALLDRLTWVVMVVAALYLAAGVIRWAGR